jgi:TRAP-type C4-dicarboxylate transport system substrate-binding protein
MAALFSSSKEDPMKRSVVVYALVVAALVAVPLFLGGAGEAAAGQSIKLIGHTMLPKEHVFFRTLEKFTGLVDQYYKGPIKIEWDLHHSGDIGTEKDAVEYMLQGVAIDFSIVSPAWIANWDKTASFMDAPFLFKSVDHWNRCLEANVFEPIQKTMIQKGVRFIGYGGGGVRHLISRKEARTIDDFPKIQMRVQGSPLHQKVFSATGLKATPMDYMEVYNAIKTGVLDGLENEPAGLQSMKFYEVAPYYVLTSHQITTRMLAMSEKKFQSLPKDLQEAVLKAAKEAAAYARKTEVAEGESIIKELQQKHGLKVIPFDNTEMRKRAMPVVEQFAKENNAADMLAKVNAIN